MKDIKLIDINKIKGFPRTYRFNSFARWFTLLMALLACSYAFYVIIARLTPEASTFHKAVPFLILFLAANSILKNLFSLNSVRFEEDRIIFGYLGKKNAIVPWASIRKMYLDDARRRLVKVTFSTTQGNRSVEFTLGFPNILEIINAMAEMCPDMEFDEFMSKVVISRIQTGRGKSTEGNA